MFRIVIILSLIVLYSSNANAQIIVNLIDNFTLESLREHTVTDKTNSLEIQRVSASCFIIEKPKKGVDLIVTSNGYIIEHLTLSDAKKEVIDLMIQPGDSLLATYRNSYNFYTYKAVVTNATPKENVTIPEEDNEVESKNQQMITTRPEKNVFNDSLKEETAPADDKIFSFPGIPAEFPGGNMELKKFIATNVRYPQRAVELGIQGTVYVQFVVSKTGNVSNVRVVRGANLPMDAESVRVIKKMPDWTPAIVDGKPVNSYYNLPIKFKLQ